MSNMSFPNFNKEINLLPQLALINIFGFLNTKDLRRAAAVCRHWRETILSSKQIHFWHRLVFNLKPPKGSYGIKNHKFHLQMCAKYAMSCQRLVIYVCRCQQENLRTLLTKISQSRTMSTSLTFRKACLNKCHRTEISYHSPWESFTMELTNVIQHLKHLQYLSLGFDCDLATLEALDGIYSKHKFSLKVLNVGMITPQEQGKSLDLTWLCQLQEVTMNVELITESLLQCWLDQKEKCNLQNLKVLMVDSNLKSTRYINSYNTENMPTDNGEDGNRFDWMTFQSQEAWQRIDVEFPALKVQLLLVAASIPLCKMLKKFPIDFPVDEVVVILRFLESSMTLDTQAVGFGEWLENQHFRHLESLVVHGIEPQNERFMDVQRGIEWLHTCCSTGYLIGKIALSGLYVPVHEVKNCILTVFLESLQISKHDLVVPSVVEAYLHIKPSASQLKSMEEFISEVLDREWKADRQIPLQTTYKHKCLNVLDIPRCLLNQYEDRLHL